MSTKDDLINDHETLIKVLKDAFSSAGNIFVEPPEDHDLVIQHFLEVSMPTGSHGFSDVASFMNETRDMKVMLHNKEANADGKAVSLSTAWFEGHPLEQIDIAVQAPNLWASIKTMLMKD